MVELNDVCLSLGLYISERNVGPFKDAFITFTEKPTLRYLKGSLYDRLLDFKGHVGYNTNFEAAHRLILDKAIENNILPNEMPTMLMVMSDMEFDAFRGWDNPTAHQMIERLYAEANAKLTAQGKIYEYKMPKMVYWNLASRHDNNPVKFAQNGAALISGFSPSIIKSVLSSGLETFTPYSVMMETISSKKYDVIQA